MPQFIESELKEFKDICTDLQNMFDKAEDIRFRLDDADAEEILDLCAKYAVLQEAIIEGTMYLQNRIYCLDRFGDYKVSQIGEADKGKTTVAEALGVKNLTLKSSVMTDYVFFRDKYKRDDED